MFFVGFSVFCFVLFCLVFVVVFFLLFFYLFFVFLCIFFVSFCFWEVCCGIMVWFSENLKTICWIWHTFVAKVLGFWFFALFFCLVVHHHLTVLPWVLLCKCVILNNITHYLFHIICLYLLFISYYLFFIWLLLCFSLINFVLFWSFWFCIFDFVLWFLLWVSCCLFWNCTVNITWSWCFGIFFINLYNLLFSILVNTIEQELILLVCMLDNPKRCNLYLRVCEELANKVEFIDCVGHILFFIHLIS